MSMIRRIHRMPRGVRVVIGCFLILLGIAGLFLPVLQGLLLLALGLYVLGLRSRWLDQRIARWKARRGGVDRAPEEPQPRT